MGKHESGRKALRHISIPKRILFLFLRIMTSPVGLATINVGYLFAGASIFLTIEADHEKKFATNLKTARTHLVDELFDIVQTQKLQGAEYTEKASWKLGVYEKELATYYRKRTSSGGNNSDQSKMWTQMGSVIYAYSVITTIGWGNIVPTTDSGRVATILYGFVGVPLVFTLSSEVSTINNKIIRILQAILTVRCLTGYSADKSMNKNTQNEKDEDDIDTRIKLVGYANSGFNHLPDPARSEVTAEKSGYDPGGGGDVYTETSTNASHHYLKSVDSTLDFLIEVSRDPSHWNNESEKGIRVKNKEEESETCFNREQFQTKWKKKSSFVRQQYKRLLEFYEKPRYKLKTMDDAVRLSEELGRLSAEDFCRIMRFAGFDFEREVLYHHRNVRAFTASATKQEESIYLESESQDNYKRTVRHVLQKRDARDDQLRVNNNTQQTTHIEKSFNEKSINGTEASQNYCIGNNDILCEVNRMSQPNFEQGSCRSSNDVGDERETLKDDGMSKDGNDDTSFALSDCPDWFAEKTAQLLIGNDGYQVEFGNSIVNEWKTVSQPPSASEYQCDKEYLPVSERQTVSEKIVRENTSSKVHFLVSEKLGGGDGRNEQTINTASVPKSEEENKADTEHSYKTSQRDNKCEGDGDKTSIHNALKTSEYVLGESSREVNQSVSVTGVNIDVMGASDEKTTPSFDKHSHDMIYISGKDKNYPRGIGLNTIDSETLPCKNGHGLQIDNTSIQRYYNFIKSLKCSSPYFNAPIGCADSFNMNDVGDTDSETKVRVTEPGRNTIEICKPDDETGHLDKVMIADNNGVCMQNESKQLSHGTLSTLCETNYRQNIAALCKSRSLSTLDDVAMLEIKKESTLQLRNQDTISNLKDDISGYNKKSTAKKKRSKLSPFRQTVCNRLSGNNDEITSYSHGGSKSTEEPNLVSNIQNHNPEIARCTISSAQSVAEMPSNPMAVGTNDLSVAFHDYSQEKTTEPDMDGNSCKENNVLKNKSYQNSGLDKLQVCASEVLPDNVCEPSFAPIHSNGMQCILTDIQLDDLTPGSNDYHDNHHEKGINEMNCITSSIIDRQNLHEQLCTNTERNSTTQLTLTGNQAAKNSDYTQPLPRQCLRTESIKTTTNQTLKITETTNKTINIIHHKPWHKGSRHDISNTPFEDDTMSKRNTCLENAHPLGKEEPNTHMFSERLVDSTRPSAKIKLEESRESVGQRRNNITRARESAQALVHYPLENRFSKDVCTLANESFSKQKQACTHRKSENVKVRGCKVKSNIDHFLSVDDAVKMTHILEPPPDGGKTVHSKINDTDRDQACCYRLEPNERHLMNKHYNPDLSTPRVEPSDRLSLNLKRLPQLRQSRQAMCQDWVNTHFSFYSDKRKYPKVRKGAENRVESYWDKVMRVEYNYARKLGENQLQSGLTSQKEIVSGLKIYQPRNENKSNGFVIEGSDKQTIGKRRGHKEQHSTNFTCDNLKHCLEGLRDNVSQPDPSKNHQNASQPPVVDKWFENNQSIGISQGRLERHGRTHNRPYRNVNLNAKDSESTRDDESKKSATGLSPMGIWELFGIMPRKKHKRDKWARFRPKDKLTLKEDLINLKKSLGTYNETESTGPEEDVDPPLLFTYFAVCIFVLLGSILHMQINPNTSEFISAIYFVFVLCSTIGFGDILPPPSSYIYELFFSLTGVAMFNIVTNATLAYMIQTLEYIKYIIGRR